MEASYHRHDISDKVWSLLEPHLPGQRGQWGGIAQNNRRFINAVFWALRTGAALAGFASRLREVGQRSSAVHPLAQKRYCHLLCQDFRCLYRCGTRPLYRYLGCFPRLIRVDTIKNL